MECSKCALSGLAPFPLPRIDEEEEEDEEEVNDVLLLAVSWNLDALDGADPAAENMLQRITR